MPATAELHFPYRASPYGITVWAGKPAGHVAVTLSERHATDGHDAIAVSARRNPFRRGVPSSYQGVVGL